MKDDYMSEEITFNLSKSELKRMEELENIMNTPHLKKELIAEIVKYAELFETLDNYGNVASELDKWAVFYIHQNSALNRQLYKGVPPATNISNDLLEEMALLPKFLIASVYMKGYLANKNNAH